MPLYVVVRRGREREQRRTKRSNKRKEKGEFGFWLDENWFQEGKLVEDDDDL